MELSGEFAKHLVITTDHHIHSTLRASIVSFRRNNPTGGDTRHLIRSELSSRPGVLLSSVARSAM